MIKMLSKYWSELTFVAEYPEAIGKKDGAVRAYYAKQEIAGSIKYCWFMGFPKARVTPLLYLNMLETAPFWGQARIADDGDFLIWRVGEFTDTPEVPLRELNRFLRFHITLANACHEFLRKSAEASAAKVDR